MTGRRLLTLLSVGALVATACSGSDDDTVSTDVAAAPPATDPPATDPPVTDPPPTDPPATDPPVTDPPPTDPPATDPPVTEPPATDPPADDDGFPSAQTIVETLASDDFNGRDNLSDGSAAARALIVETIVELSEPLDADGSYLQPYDVGTNIVGLIPGSGDLAEEFVLVGAHYDHLAPGECDTRGVVDDVICNGAADNAAGVAAVLSIAHSFASTEPPAEGERSMVIAFWDGEEDGLVGAEAYVADPLVPLEATVAYVNFDIQGAQLLPALASSTVLVGPETGGQQLVDAADRATSASSLDYATFSLIFGQGRSDHAVLAAAGVPSVFFTDANNGCYHTVLDDPEHVDFDKLDAQIATAEALTFDLLSTATPPAFAADAPLTTFDDATEMLALLRRGEPDFGLLPDGGVSATAFLADLQAVVDAGSAGFDDLAGGVLLGGAADLVAALADAECSLPS